jgi:hypothetical protein
VGVFLEFGLEVEKKVMSGFTHSGTVFPVNSVWVFDYFIRGASEIIIHLDTYEFIVVIEKYFRSSGRYLTPIDQSV